MSDFRKCTTPGAIYEFSIHGNVLSMKVTLKTLHYLKVSNHEFDTIVHDALEDLIGRVLVDGKKTSSAHWEHKNSKLEDVAPNE